MTSLPINPSGGVQLLATGIPGLDSLAAGGLPLGRVTLVSGTAGAGKTVFATQFLAAGVRTGEAGVLVTLEESAADLRTTMLSLGWDIAGFEGNGKWVMIDGSVRRANEEALIGDFDLGGLLARIQAAIVKVGAQRVVIDAISALFVRFGSQDKVRSELFRIGQAIRAMGVTLLMTAERSAEHAATSRYEIEEFVADNVIVLRNGLDDELRRRTPRVHDRQQRPAHRLAVRSCAGRAGRQRPCYSHGDGRRPADR